jgi:hypothetical protein
MKVREIYDAIGGRSYIMRLTDLQPPQVSRMYTRNRIPSHWVRLFIALRPELDWHYLLDFDSPRFIEILDNSFIRDVRLQRMRNTQTRDAAAFDS